MKPVQVTGTFRRSTAIGIFYKKVFTVTPQEGETIRDAWYREHSNGWDVFGMRTVEPTDSLDGGAA
jgi:hypothetical protein|tara:strand:+ start:1524 stop:1721 length:198 start_codon:yes stop_codon:yes gene_type:complete